MRFNRISFLRIGQFLSFASLIALACSPLIYADDANPGQFQAVHPSGDPNDECGPCTAGTDKNYTKNGIGNGFCGRCQTVTWTANGGTCTGQTGSSGSFNCHESSTAAVHVDTWTSTPVGSVWYAGCTAVSIAALTGLGAFDVAVCGPACVVGGVVTLGATCWGCIAGNVAAATGISCTFDDCIEDCTLTSHTNTGTTTMCWSH